VRRREAVVMGFGLQKFDAGSVTKRLVLDEISTDAKKPLTLLVRYTGTANRDWDNFMLRNVPPAKNTPAEADDPTEPTALAAHRLKVRAENHGWAIRVLAETSIVGWENVLEDGKPAEFSREAAARFFGELVESCPDVWGRILLFVQSLSNFRASAIDEVGLGKE
jgi:hypothetical protein